MFIEYMLSIVKSVFYIVVLFNFFCNLNVLGIFKFIL